MRQVLVLRIHADGRLVLSELAGRERSFEGEVVAFLLNHLQRLYVVYLLVAVLVEANVDLLQAYSIVQALLVDDVLDSVLPTSLATGSGEVPLTANHVDGIPTLGNGFLPLSNVLSQLVVVL